jgi:N-acetylmuramoyl-L-alanine amidase
MLEWINIGVMCLALNIYHEARNQDLDGMYAVADVVMNRVDDYRYPNDVCGVVKQGPVRESWKTVQTADPTDAVYYPVKHRCQFSWYCDGKDDTPYDKEAWNVAQTVASYVQYYGSLVDTQGATHYHTDYVKPEWASTKTRTLKVGNHIFYRWEK